MFPPVVTSTLSLQAINRTQAGEIKCTASNELNSKAKAAKLTVWCKFVLLVKMVFPDWMCNIT